VTRDPAAALAAAGRELHALGLSPGTSGNLSVRTGDGLLVTPTGAGLGTLTAGAISRLDAEGRPLQGPPPTKEVPLHLALYRRLPTARAVVHLHSTHAVAVSCCEVRPPRTTDDVLPALTPYFRMRVGKVPLCPYAPPGSEALAASVAAAAPGTRAVLLANHGPAATGGTLEEAVAAAVEVAEAAKLHLLLDGRPVRLRPADAGGAPR
jgi:ribulose-5-phosphate 4-epimerase/fuculose-1-phosphate aldolase